MKLIVSLTSYPGRIKTADQAIKSVLKQSLRPDILVLWLAEEEFPLREAELPENLLQLLDYGLTIEWYHNIKSYKKMIPALRKYPNDLIITADDDLIYSEKWLELLYSSYLKYPRDIQAHRITKIEKKDGVWNNIAGGWVYYRGSSFLNKLTGGAGALYPPGTFLNDVFKEELFMKLAPSSDDLWFWFMAMKNDIKVRVVEGNIAKLNYIEGTQDKSALWRVNDQGENLFWKHFYNITDNYPILLRKMEEEYSYRMLHNEM